MSSEIYHNPPRFITRSRSAPARTSVCLTASVLLGAFLLLDAYIFYASGLPFSQTIPCSQGVCDFTVLSGHHLSDDYILWLGELWNIRIQNLDLTNITSLYYCGKGGQGHVSFDPCDIHHIYIT